MGIYKKVGILVTLVLLLAACGGGDENAAVTSTEAPETTAESTTFTIFDLPETTAPATTVEETTTTEAVSLIDGFAPAQDQSDMIVESDSPNVAIVEGETVFALDAPGDCKETPIGIDVPAKQVIFELYWNCLYRPIVVTDDDHWLQRLQSGTGGTDRAFLRQTGIGGSREASCMRGGATCKVPVDLGEGVRAECSFDFVVVPHERAGIRLQNVCSNEIRYSVAEK